jgi:hypothetical protein
LTDELDRKNRLIDERAAENSALRGRVQELEEQLRAAAARALTAAAQPGATQAAIAAADALGTGDTRPAEALLSNQEREEAGQIGAADADDARQRSQAAAPAREQGALAMGHDARAALAAFERAAEYEPDDTWTHFFIGDLYMQLGDLSAARQSCGRGAALAEALAARDPVNTGWQRDVAVSCSKLGTLEHPQTVATRRNYLLRGRAILAGLKDAGRLHPNQDWIAWFDRQLAQLPPGPV